MNETYAKRYRAPFIEPGIISYEDLEAGTVLVRRGALDRMRETFIGMPVVNEDHIDLTPEQAYKVDPESDPQAVGIVVAVGTDEYGWDYADLIIWDRATQENIDKNGYSVSCAYMPEKVDSSGGVWHNIPYDEEVIDGSYQHMAIVDTPRYEGARIYPNSKERKRHMKFKLSKKDKQKKNAVPPPEEKEPEEELESESAVIEVDGEMIPVAEAIAAYQKIKENEVVPLSPEDTVEIDGEQVTVAELVAACQAGKENVGEPKEVKAEEVVDEQMQKKNKVKPKEEKKNKNFTVLKNASEATAIPNPGLTSKADKLARGKLKYGTAKKEATA